MLVGHIQQLEREIKRIKSSDIGNGSLAMGVREARRREEQFTLSSGG
jgi:hypothetical protein